MADLPKLVQDSPDSYVAQIAQILRDAITTGRLAPGAALPSRRALTEHFGVAHMTVAAAVATLKTEGWLVGRQGKAVYVRSRPIDAEPWGEEAQRVAVMLVRAAGGQIRIPEHLLLPAPGWTVTEFRDPVTREWVVQTARAGGE